MTDKAQYRAHYRRTPTSTPITSSFDADNTEQALKRVCDIERINSVLELHEFVLHAINPDKTITELATTSPGSKVRVTAAGVSNLLKEKQEGTSNKPTGLAALSTVTRKMYATIRV